MNPQPSTLNPQQQCSYCGLSFSGSGYTPDGKSHFCCCGCYLVQQIVAAKGEEGIASWILIRLGLGAFLSMNVMMISIVLYAQSTAELGVSAVHSLRWAMLILSTPAMLILGAPFVTGSIKELRRGKLSTDALILTGSAAAFAVSAAHVVGSGHVYFDTATMLLVIVTFGRLLEATAKMRTSRAIRAMVELTPDTARVVREGTEIEIPSDQVVKGDLMLVKPGERIPVDGKIVSGSCLIEESAFTGEARPRSCSVGDVVYGGSVSCDGLVRVEALAAKSDSLLSRIQRSVQEAQQSRAPIERLAERVASVFVPMVWLIAIAAAIYWGAARGDLERAGLSSLAVLVVACPCALGIATSVATCLAIGKAARAGVMIRNGEVLERLPNVRRIFFDKTGTLTQNRMMVEEISCAKESVSPDEALAWAASVEAGSEHIIARAIVDAAKSRGLALGDVSNFKVFPGQGVQGVVTLDGETRLVTAGSLKLFGSDSSWSASPPTPDTRHPAPDSDLTTVFVGWDGSVQAAISLSDTARPEAEETIGKLNAMSVGSAVISGDREAPTHGLAEQLGIAAIFAECSPEDKVEIVRKARQTGECAAMVGDGINDAPALSEAYVGIAIGGGTDLARQSSDLTLLGDDLTRIPWVLDMSKLTYRIIRQNLAWAFGYNMVAICLGFFGLVHPLIAAGAMVISSLTVIGNSMRLLKD